MLFPYKYINHPIENLQQYLDHLFLEVWCKADASIEYDLSLLHPVLQEIIKEIYYDANIPVGKYLYEPIEEVYSIFQLLDNGSKHNLGWAYVENNCIQDLCEQTKGVEPITYEDLKVYHPKLPNVLQDFYENLYNKVLGLKAVKDRIGELGDHYTSFVTENDEGKCPYCGLNSIKGQYNSKREAYDHYLPKSIYPFNSVNFMNLAPMCNECNSSYKLAKDPINARPKKNPLKSDNGNRRKAFFSYCNNIDDLQLQVSFEHRNLNSLSPNNITVTFGNVADAEEIETWKDVFGIEERYKAKCLEKNEGKFWFEQATDEYDNYPDKVKAIYTREEWVDKLIDEAKRHPFANAGFLKAIYLQECKRIGAFG
jgi:hypothetical protein